MEIPTIYAEEHLSEPWFTLISLGLKTCEGRLHKHRFKTYKIGDIIKWWNNDFDKGRVCFTKIININLYNTFEEYLIDKGLKNCLPGMPNLEHGLDVYLNYFGKEDETKYGVVSFELEIIN
jgi:ASC-1-like (ASCH) protein